MLIFLSDLHLADTLERTTLDISRFLNCMNEFLNRAFERQVKDLTIVFLGDIFELLRSKEWLLRGLRPWEECTTDHGDTVTTIFEKIVKANRFFFEGFQKLAGDFPFVQFEYIPGNHDRAINTEMGKDARARLQRILKFQQQDGKRFDKVFVDNSLGIIAKHGNEWDPYNRYSEEAAAIGDAIVIDLLLRLPELVSEELGINQNDSCLEFIHEADNVCPQHPRVIAKWLLAGLDRMQGTYSEAPQAIHDSFLRLTDKFKTLTNSANFEPKGTAGWWVNFLLRVVKHTMKRFGTLRTVVRLPGGESDSKPYQLCALEEVENAFESGDDYRYIICGHTHMHELVPLQVENEHRASPLYINTGTWRRTHQIAKVPREKKIASFSTWQEECVVSFYSLEEQTAGLPAYEIHRFTVANSLDLCRE